MPRFEGAAGAGPARALSSDLMLFPDDSVQPAAAAIDVLPSWFLVSIPLLGLGLLFIVGIGVAGLWTLQNHVRRLEELAGRLAMLESIQASLKVLCGQRGDLDVRRLEHVLIEIREGQKRLDETLLSTLENSRARGVEIIPQGSPANLADRVVNRLVALGYERVQILTPSAELGALANGAEDEGEIVVEARRHGAACKGRVQVRSGMLADVHMQPTYGAFP